MLRLIKQTEYQTRARVNQLLHKSMKETHE
ncbi:MAG: hypothetical protein UR54_C0023G0008 [Candidatus Roizmanbacteria bacterium GW2011_GWA2_34_18]|uniref:Uncharacterized protein n=1 Tax=Candidatus Roizmanbacteria bacterium GW2011_GWA2_34_18 TaxID=1618477 RepID=A0A0G0B7R5_9BACT|nr:MAG: hypothetical protein UR54_C0023G0008 [Candidatus Roizmanbacteria bacterium GW2011_GWA2_34_18]